jgi:Na+-translocating ferredoxin:NAD+ oxidoreductase RnfG subunit
MICSINRPVAIALLALTLSAAPSTAGAEEVYWTTKDLLKDFFKTSEKVTYVRVEGAREKRELASMLGYQPRKETYVVFVAKTGGQVDGYAVIDEEMGQHLPITFGVKLSRDGQVERLEVMVYREGYGDEIRERRFRRQFEGKTKLDDIRFGGDIVAVSGATISSKAMAIGVRRAVALVTVAEQHVLASN